MLNIFDFEAQFEQAILTLFRRFDDFQAIGSGWVVDKIDFLDDYTAEYSAIGGSTYVKLQVDIFKRNSVLNIKNEDDRCFSYCVAAHMHKCAHSANANSPTQYEKYFSEFDMTGLDDGPITTNRFHKFEQQNTQLGINLLTIDKDGTTIVPLYTSKFVNQRPKHANLLIFNGLNKDKILCNHFALITKLPRLLAYTTKTKNAISVCPYCLLRYCTKVSLQKHILDCGKYPPLRIQFPHSNINNNSDEVVEDIQDIAKLLELMRM